MTFCLLKYALKAYLVSLLYFTVYLNLRNKLWLMFKVENSLLIPVLKDK